MAVASDVKRNGNSGGVNKHKTIFAVACVIVLIALITLVVMKGGGKVGHAIYIGQDVVTVTDGKFAPEVELKEGEELESFLIKVKADVFDICTKVDLTKIFTVYGNKGLTKVECTDSFLVIGSAFNDPNTKAYGKGTYPLFGLQFINPGVDSAKLTFERFEVKDNGEKILSAPPGKVITLNFNVKPDQDTDKDMVIDTKDNCPTIANTDQKDSDNTECPAGQGGFEADGITAKGCVDGFGNACDNCLTIYNKDQKDTDKDKTGDACDLTPCGANTVWNSKECVCSSGWQEEVLGDIAKAIGCTKKVDVKLTSCLADDSTCGAFCTANTGKYCPASGSYKADLNGDGVYDGADADIVFKTRDSKSRDDCGLKDQAPCPYNENAFYVCDEGTYRVVGTGIRYMFGKLDYTFNANDKCPYVMENVPGAVK